jgi:exonuclease III
VQPLLARDASSLSPQSSTLSLSPPLFCAAAQFFVVCLYVPNSGQSLERLEYRTTEWDVALRAWVAALEAEGKPVIVTGDLNVAHL